MRTPFDSVTLRYSIECERYQSGVVG
jgi:hypothetical protein